MFQRRPRRFRRRLNDRGGPLRGNDQMPIKLRPHSFSNSHARNKFRPTLSAEKLFEKYNALAKEAMSSGDKTLSENYFQHADHYMRIIEDKNKNQAQRKPNLIQKPTGDDKHLSQNNDINQGRPTDNKE